jgi:hypothetical protein
MDDIDAVWRRIEAHAGETFRQVRGAEFTYRVEGSSVWPDRTNRNLARSQFAQALDRWPLTSTTQLQDLQGPSYLFAILTDDRIAR